MTIERRTVTPPLAIGLACIALVPSCSSARSVEPQTDESRERVSTSASPSISTTAVVTHHNDARRSGAVGNETTLNAANVRSSFGLVGRAAVDGQIYAQPLYVGGLTIGGAVHNVVFVATEKSSIYAFDADTLVPLWTKSLLGSGETGVPGSDHYDTGYATLWPDIGITGTPVIDVATNSLYVVTVTRTGAAHSQMAKLHHLYLTSGDDVPRASPLPPSQSITGTFSDGLVFDVEHAHQRAALLLTPPSIDADPTIYVAFGTYGDCLDDKCWSTHSGAIFAFNARTLATRGLWHSSPSIEGPSAIWQAGSGPAADAAGDVYFMTGNGGWNGSTSFGNSVVKLHLSTGGLSLASYFTPKDHHEMAKCDTDLGSAGPALLPDLPGAIPHQLLGGGKSAKLYLLNRDALGGFSTTDSSVIDSQLITSGLPADLYSQTNCAVPAGGVNSGNQDYEHEGEYHIHGSPVLWTNPQGTYAYVWGEKNKLRRFRVDQGKIDIATSLQAPLPDGQAPFSSSTAAMPGGSLSLSSDPTGANGIVWSSMPNFPYDNGKAVLPGVLRAFDANSLTELWNSAQRTGDAAGNYAKFVPPTVADGNVFLPAFQDQNPTLPDYVNPTPSLLDKNQLLKFGLLTRRNVIGSLQPGQATDIAIGITKDRDTWITGTDCTGVQCGIYHWNADLSRWEGSYGTALAIDVGPQGPWVIGGGNVVFKWDGTQFVDLAGQGMPGGGGIDIGVGASGDVWVVGTNSATAGGNQVFKYDFRQNGSLPPSSHPSRNMIGFQGASLAQGAKRIDVAPDGTAWIVDSANQIFHSTTNDPTTTAWTHVAGLATDVAVGADGNVYVLGTSQATQFVGTQNHDVYKYDGSQFNLVPGVGAVRISAGPGGIAVVADPHLPVIQADFTPLSGCAKAVGSGWVIGCDAPSASGKGRQIYHWDPSSQTFVAVPGIGESITVDLNGTAWVVNGLGSIFRWSGTAFVRFPSDTDTFVASSVASGSTDTETWAIRKSDSTIWRWSGTTWVQTGGSATKVAVFSQADACVGHVPWVINSSNQVFQYTSASGCASASFQRFSATALDITTDYVVGATGMIHHFTAGAFTPYRLAPWTPTTGTRIGAGPAGLFAMSTGTAGSIQRVDLQN